MLSLIELEDTAKLKRLPITSAEKDYLQEILLFSIKGKIKEINKYDREINVRFLLNGPLYRGVKEAQCYIPLNISLREQPVYEPNKINFISLYKEIPNFDIFSMQEKEILAEKIRAIFTRIKPRRS